MITLDHVSYSRCGRNLVSDVSHVLTPAKLTVLLGANGAGKSSLVRLMSGEWTPASGEVHWNGTPLSRLSSKISAQRRAVVSQQHTSTFAFRVIDLILMGRLPHTRFTDCSDMDIACEALELVGLSGYADRRVNTLSGGEQQRAHLARALAQLHEARKSRSGILLLDEPTAHLDMGHQQRALQLARRLAGEGLTVMAVLHDVNLAAAYADQILLMHQGRLVASGSVLPVLTNPILSEVLQVDFEILPHPDGRPVFVPASSRSAN